MTDRDPARGPVTAAELRARPEMIAQEREHERRVAQARQEYQQAAEGLLAELAGVGFPVETVGDLTREFQRTGRRYEAAVPVLLRWLPQVSYRPLQADIVHALAVPWAKRTAAPPLIERFRSLPPHQGDAQDPRWEVGNALEVLAHQAVAADLLELAQDRRYGYARQPVVLGLGRLRPDPTVVDTLIRLLDDPEVTGARGGGAGQAQGVAGPGAIGAAARSRRAGDPAGGPEGPEEDRPRRCRAPVSLVPPRRHRAFPLLECE